jgi:uncharacterized protein (TIGR02996 family)
MAIAVTSTYIKSIDYGTKGLCVEFKPKPGESRGKTYHYPQVTQEQFNEMRDSASVSRYFWQHFQFLLPIEHQPMDSTARALLNAILAAPDDDAPRLIYADWLDEHGEAERAEFIRVQCELARIGPKPNCEWVRRGRVRCDEAIQYRCRSCILNFRSRELLRLLFWLSTDDPVQLAFDSRQNPCPYVRGFAERITLTAADMIANLDAIREQHPIRDVWLTTWPTGEFDQDHQTAYTLSERWPGITFHLPEQQTHVEQYGDLRLR